MRVNEIKAELEIVAKVIPELRKELDEAYQLETGKKTRMKLLWNQYAPRVKELKATKEFRDLLH